ncbi:hypothetical protein HAX54_032762 [Datura stramonium]|uniref:Uncharacterized protein n=1 Tax=Datura stramonium TaxID=4076 RepID=A0ABS8VBU7_DATST|nr:hypothetical protein [Datura stramonium]
MKDVVDNFLGKIMTKNVPLLKYCTHQNVVAASPPRCDENLRSCHVPPSEFGEVRYTSGYWEWTKFWFRGPRKYVEPSQMLSKNRMKLRMNRDPFGDIDMSFLPRIKEENAPFVELGMEESLRD